ncbi:glycosyltransferase family 2 protein [Sediminibacterium sp. C3]|uniref:glycosyltransferase family 2 protein n=1 Tax=Sediminibacterium sp. C3 TaxID=1267211 RepID=UPI0003F9A68D|nr:glycosyltransferase family 2 protein [Sediminibacterium sp. C3]
MLELSVIIPVYDEAENIDPLIKEIYKSLSLIDYEIIFVDDSSTDDTCKKIQNFLIQDERISLIQFKRNYGQSTAMVAGIEYSSGEYIAFLDGDLQNDPINIPEMLGKLKSENWDMVAGNRKNRQDGTFLRKIPSKIANFVIRITTNINIKDYGCTLKVMKREVAQDLDLRGELHRFIPLLASFGGASITQMDVLHHSRKFGKSKYGINRTFKVLSDLIFLLFFKKYSQKSMHLFGTMGVIGLFLGVIINLYLLSLKLAGNAIWGKPLLIVGVIFLLGGIQLISIGILAEIGMGTYNLTINKKKYAIKKIYGKIQNH